ncbi:MAG: hypothetical protein AAGF26_17655, partial [Cyanobacteria bacterium P01_G01_bin.49]
MYGNSTNQSVFLLPQLKADCDVSSDRPGEWNLQPSKAFNDVATSLEYQAPGAVKTISSVPTMWAYPLTLEMVLYDSNHSLRPQMIEQWQGMLAAIALAEMRGFPLKAKLVELGDPQLKGEGFARSLFDLLPDYRGRNLYTLENKHPWQDVYVFLWDKKPVGMTSPSTLVVPSLEGNWETLPWWNPEQKRLQAPQNHLNKEEQALLWGWLKNLTQKLNEHNGDSNALNIMKGLIGNFQGTLQQNPDLTLSLSKDPQFFGEIINRGALFALNYPVQAPERPSSVKVIPSREKVGNQKPDLLIYDPDMARVWNKNPQNIWLHEGKTLASLKPEEFAEFKKRWQREVILLEKNELFLPELYFIELEDGLPGGFLPPSESSDRLYFNNLPVTPLLPLNSILLDYLSPQDLINRLKFQMLRTEAGIRVRLTLDLPLSGVDLEQTSQSYRLYKDYELKAENSLGNQLPILQVWPDFSAEGWQEYYGFYYDAELEDATFQVSFPTARYSNQFEQGLGKYQIAKLDEFPESINCFTVNHELIGLILLKNPRTVQLRSKWHIGVDFGTSFTNVYVSSQDRPEPLKLENLQRQITDSNRETLLNVLVENFIPTDFIPKQKPLPLSSVLTTRPNESNGKIYTQKKMRPILDGR